MVCVGGRTNSTRFVPAAAAAAFGGVDAGGVAGLFPPHSRRYPRDLFQAHPMDGKAGAGGGEEGFCSSSTPEEC